MTVGKPSTPNFSTSFGFCAFAWSDSSESSSGESTMSRTYFSAAALRNVSVANTSRSSRLHHPHQSLPEKSTTTYLFSAAAFLRAAS